MDIETKTGVLACYCGLVPYEKALEWQRQLAKFRSLEIIPDMLLLLQHLPVYTIGRFRGMEDIKEPSVVLNNTKVSIFHTDRGGSITFHGPGQLVGYPIIKLKKYNLGVREYLGKIEQVILNVLSDFKIKGYRLAGFPGVWAEDKKICSIGIHISQGITTHGFALNINTDLHYFDYINACGIKGNIMTSMAELLGRRIDQHQIVDKVIWNFSEIFGVPFRMEEGGWKTIHADLIGLS